MKYPIKLLIVDDSRLMRHVISKIFEASNDVQVVGEATNGKEALEMIPTLKPDVITLDINMPIMDGITTLKHIMIKHPTPVVMCSTLTEEGTATAFDTLKFGAVDFIHKPSNQHPETLEAQHETIRKKVTLAAHVEMGAVRYLKVKPKTASAGKGGKYSYICGIGAAEGGYSSLLKLIPLLKSDIPAAFIVVLYESSQHVDSFVKYLNENSHLKIERAIDAVPIECGVCYIASGDEQVTLHSFYGEYLKVTASNAPSERKSINQLLLSLAEVMKNHASGVILSGSGLDGVDGMNEIVNSKGIAIVQDPKTCLFKEMPASVIDKCAIKHIVPDTKVAQEINNQLK